MRLSARWTRNQDKETSESTRKLLLRSKSVIQRLRLMLEEDKKQLQDKSSSVNAFQDPNWAYQQAFYLGQINQLSKILEDLLPDYKGN